MILQRNSTGSRRWIFLRSHRNNFWPIRPKKNTVGRMGALRARTLAECLKIFSRSAFTGIGIFTTPSLLNESPLFGGSGQAKDMFMGQQFCLLSIVLGNGIDDHSDLLEMTVSPCLLYHSAIAT